MAPYLKTIVLLTVLTGCASPAPVHWNGPQVMHLGNNGGSLQLVKQGPIYYPAEAKRLGVTGTVTMLVLVDLDGTVLKASVASRNLNKTAIRNDDGTLSDVTTIFDKAAIESLMQSKYKVEKTATTPEPIFVRYPLNFTLP